MSDNGVRATGIGDQIMIIYSAVRRIYEWGLLLTHLYYAYE